jgi:hypothetical protein
MRNVHVTEMDEAPTIQHVIDSMIDAESDEAVLVAHSKNEAIVFKIQILEVIEKC